MSASARLLLLVLAIAGLAGASACGAAARGSAPDRSTPLLVQNQSWSDIRIYVVASGQRIRLGSVTGNSTTTLRIPGSVVGLGRQVSFIADPLGSNAVASSYELFVMPGERVTLTIPSRIR